VPRHRKTRHGEDLAPTEERMAAERLKPVSMDRYDSYASLRSHERPGVDFVVRLRWGLSGIAVMAPHGGRIEPGTSEIARSIAGRDHTLYEFVGIKDKNNHALHLRSERFDEPRALEVIDRSRFLLIVHGCVGAKEVLYLGGGTSPVKHELNRHLQALGLTVQSHSVYKGRHPGNLCNRLGNGSGLQLEFSAGLRNRLAAGSGGGVRQGCFPSLVNLSRVINRVISRTMPAIKNGTTEG
jgi:phage replication-related protein YjqB (UPF0714/DUF867 family)